MRRLKRLLAILALFSLALPPALPQSYFVTEEQLAQLESESRLQREELARQRELLDAQEARLKELNSELAKSARELESSRQALKESREALSEAQSSLRQYDSRSFLQKVLIGAASLIVGCAGGIVAGYFIGK